MTRTTSKTRRDQVEGEIPQAMAMLDVYGRKPLDYVASSFTTTSRQSLSRYRSLILSTIDKLMEDFAGESWQDCAHEHSGLGRVGKYLIHMGNDDENLHLSNLLGRFGGNCPPLCCM